MSTTAPDVTVDTTIGQVIVPTTPTSTPTATATATSTATTSTSASLTPSSTPLPTPSAISLVEIPLKKYYITPLSIYGYGPKDSQIILTGFGVSERITSDASGYFRFYKIYSYSSVYPELCIVGLDNEKRATQPSCIPALVPGRSIPVEVGPVFLSPTISINANNIKSNEISIASGFSIPNSKLYLHLSKLNRYNLPVLEINSSISGSFEFTLPTSEVSSYRFFLSSRVGEDNVPKSNSITFSVNSGFTNFAYSVKDIFLNNKLGTFVVLELIIVMILGVMVLKSRKRVNKQ